MNQVSLIGENSGEVHIHNSTINFILDRNEGSARKSQEIQSTVTKNVTDYTIREEDEEDETWLQSGKLLMFHNRPIHSSTNIYHGKQFLPGQTRDVAIKLIRYDLHVMNDLHFLVKLNHPNIVQFVDAGEYHAFGHWLYIAMELCDKNLQQYIDGLKGRPVDFETCTLIFKQLLQALEFLKANNVIHRDIKPDNILLTFEGTPKLADFGISRDIPQGRCDITRTSSGVGSDGYRSPEMYQDGARLSPALDIFSLGLVACFLFSNGQHPFGSDPYSWSYNIRNNKRMDLSVLKSGSHVKCRLLIQLVKSMLQHNPRDRPTASQILEDVFFKEPLLELKKSRSKSSILNLFRNSKDEGDTNQPHETSTVDIKLGELVCNGFLSNFYKASFKNMTVCVEKGNDRSTATIRKKYFQGKLQALRELRHQNIIRLLAFTVDEPRCLVLEFVGNETVYSHVSRTMKSLTIADRMEISLQITNGMAYMAEKKYVHGNLCAEGILMTNGAVVKISRFRCVKRLDDGMKMDGIEVFRKRWAAPEVITSLKLGPMSDVWSFGVVLYEIFSNGDFPYRGISWDEMPGKVLEGYRCQKPDDCPDVVYQRMEQCWQLEPEKRPNFSQLQEFFRNWNETEGRREKRK